MRVGPTHVCIIRNKKAQLYKKHFWEELFLSLIEYSGQSKGSVSDSSRQSHERRGGGTYSSTDRPDYHEDANLDVESLNNQRTQRIASVVTVPQDRHSGRISQDEIAVTSVTVEPRIDSVEENNGVVQIAHVVNDAQERLIARDSSYYVDTVVGGDNSQDIELGANILVVMGKRLTQDKVFAAPIHKALAVRLNEIILAGLPKEEKIESNKKYIPPKNCKLMEPPSLNLEVKASLQESIVKRAERIVMT